MTYSITIDNNIIDLPEYNFTIADKLERQENVNTGKGRLKDKCKSMYDTISDIIGMDNTMDILGKFADADPNRINIVYLSIVNAYNEPLNKFSEEHTFEKLDTQQIDKIVNLINALEKANNLRVIK